MDKKAREKALEDYINGLISFERLAEEMDINFYALHQAFTHFAGLLDRPELREGD